MRKIIVVSGLLISFFLMPLSASAMGILPSSDKAKGYSIEECITIVDAWTTQYLTSGYSGLPETLDTAQGTNTDDMMTCALKSGYMSFWMLPLFVINIQEFIIGLAGLVAVLMIMVGAYYYIAGAATDDKEKGKTIIKYALGGFALILSSWILVNILLLVLTS